MKEDSEIQDDERVIIDYILGLAYALDQQYQDDPQWKELLRLIEELGDRLC